MSNPAPARRDTHSIGHLKGPIIITMSALAFAALLASIGGTSGKTVRSPTPPMGWNSYNHYNCYPSEDIIKINAKGLVDLGFLDLGYSIVTVDCGWPSRDRDSEGRLQWNETLFPSGPKALGEYIHDLGLEFGLYSGAGYLQCGSYDIPASLGYEEIDAKSFAEWGGDTLKYDNCYATSKTDMVDSDSAEAKSPDRFIKMAAAINETDRDIKYFLCQWGIGEDVPQWATQVGNSWRMSNDIFNAWRAIWRITNQAVAHSKYNRPGAFADLDMLIIGLGALSYEEERFHFGLWSMMKSPLIIGGVMDAKQIPAESLEVMSNKEAIAINQDALGQAAELVIRYTEEEWDVWSGNLSSSRKVLGVANWKNETQTVEVDLALIGVEEAKARDVWAHKDLTISGTQKFELKPHELRLLVLSDISQASKPKPSGYYPASKASLDGSASLADCGDNECLPANEKVKSIGEGAKATFKSVSAPKDGSLYVGVDYINHEYHHTIGDWETNSRNMSISVNGEDSKRWAFPNAGGDWFESDRMVILLDGFKKGDDNTVTFTTSSSGDWAPDLVGFEVLA
ncbi:putative alpha-galactosidase D [Fusarium venenatum]|nr:putative alpha-galactosidase D [Fusarium venenatum]